MVMIAPETLASLLVSKLQPLKVSCVVQFNNSIGFLSNFSRIFYVFQRV